MGVGGFNLGLGSLGLGMPSGLNMAQLNGTNAGMNPFNMNMLGMANLSAMGISPEAQLLAAQLTVAGGDFGQANLVGLGGIGGCRAASVVTMDSESVRVGPMAACQARPQRQQQKWIIVRRQRQRGEEKRRRF
jgi:hypothetical protein